MSKEKNVYNLLKLLDNIDGNKVLNLFKNNKDKIESSNLFCLNFLRNFLISCYFFTVIFFLYQNYDYFSYNNYQISIEESIYLLFSLLSVIIYWFIFDFFKFFINKFFNLKYKYLIENFEKKENEKIKLIIQSIQLFESLNLRKLIEYKIEEYNNQDSYIIKRVIKQTSFRSNDKRVNDFLNDLNYFNEELEVE